MSDIQPRLRSDTQQPIAAAPAAAPPVAGKTNWLKDNQMLVAGIVLAIVGLVVVIYYFMTQEKDATPAEADKKNPLPIKPDPPKETREDLEKYASYMAPVTAVSVGVADPPPVPKQFKSVERVDSAGQVTKYDSLNEIVNANLNIDLILAAIAGEIANYKSATWRHPI